MDWKNRISKFSGKMTKEKWLLLLLIGVLLMILSFPLPGGSKKDKNAGGQIAGAGTEGAGAVPLWTKDNTNGSGEDSGFGQGSSQNGMAQGPDGNGAGASDGREDSYPAAARTSEDGSIGVANLTSSSRPAQPNTASKICPKFIREGTPSGFKQISTGVPSSKNGISS